MRIALTVVGLCVWLGSADAQVFKPRGAGKPTATKTDKATDKTADKKAADKSDAPAKKSTASKKSPAKTSSRKPVTSKAARGKGRPDDLTPEPVKKADPDFVVVTDDDDD